MKNNLITLLSIVLLTWSCGNDSASSEGATETDSTTAQIKKGTPDPNNDGAGDFSEPREMPAYRLTDEFKEYYSEAEAPRKIDYDMDISGMSYAELYFLKWEIMGQNGFMYIDDILRAKLAYGEQYHYQPVFWEDNYRPDLLPAEQALIDRLDQRMSEIARGYYQPAGGGLVDMDAVVNTFQYDAGMVADMIPKLGANGFAIVPAKHEQLFHLYDENNYSTLPSFVTTDLYLQVFHIFFQYLIKDLEENHFIGELTGICKQMHGRFTQLYNNAEDAGLREAAAFGQMYFALGYELLSGKSLAYSGDLSKNYKDEMQRIKSASGQGSEFLKYRFFDYSLFKPRGHYTRTAQLGQYFKAMIWLQTAPMTEDHPAAFHAGLLAGWLLAENAGSNEINRSYNRIFEPVRFIAGEPNKLAVVHVRDQFLANGRPSNPGQFLTPEALADWKIKLREVFIPGYDTKSANDTTEKEVKKLKLVFFPQRYTLDGEILSRLVDIKRKNLNTPPKRPVPKGMDVFAAFGNPLAKDILLNEFKEGDKWKDYPDTLANVTAKFTAFRGWDENVYNKWMEGLMTLDNQSEKHPYFMKTDAWGRKDLNTALASWAELKHDMILYADQPNAAQMGSGGEWPEPVLVGFVEPKVEFWKKCGELLGLTRQVLKRFSLETNGTSAKIDELVEVAEKFRVISEKELRGEELTSQEYDYIRYIGGNIEQITLRVMDSDAGFWYQVTGPDKCMAIVADVYTYQGFNKKVVLEEAVAYGDEIYVVVEMKGKLYLTRGAVFSYREFEQPIDNRLTDEEWQKMLKEDKAPARPGWVNPIIVETAPAE